MGMSTNVTPKPDSQLWGIYHANREHARELGDPLRTVIEASNKLIAEETAARLGFGDPRAYPVTSKEMRHAQWLHKCRPGNRREREHKTLTRHPHLIMQTPTTAQLRTAIEVLTKLGERLDIHAEHSVMQLSESQLGAHYAGRIEVGAIEQTTRIEAVATQLKCWRDELLQQERQCVSHHV
jgi:hypothetical protein